MTDVAAVSRYPNSGSKLTPNPTSERRKTTQVLTYDRKSYLYYIRSKTNAGCR
jgi:hypothetical protein